MCPWGKNFFILAPFDRKIKNAALHMARDMTPVGEPRRLDKLSGCVFQRTRWTGEKPEKGSVSVPERTR